jgi:NAD(P) transhydrogenase subunit alpha
VESVGATFLDLAGPDDGAGTGGYARALDPTDQAQLRAALAAHLARHDIVIATAQVPRPPAAATGRRGALEGPGTGSVIVDLAASPLGGNVAMSRPGETVVTDEKC